MNKKTLTFQHTRAKTYWPDIEEIEEEKDDLLLVKRSQLNEGRRYAVTARDEEGHISEMKIDTGEEEYWAVYNPGLDRYYIRSKVIDKPFKTPQHMTGHRAFYNKDARTIIWMVPRNGSCTILATLMATLGYKTNVGQPALIWSCAGQQDCFFDEQEGKLSSPEKWINYRHCIVYQDPLLKTLRHMNYILSVNRPQLSTFFSEDISKMHNMDTFIDTYLAIAEINKRNNASYYEQHMIPQMFYHQTLPVTPDTIIHLDDLEHFLHYEMGLHTVKANLETSIGLSIGSITEKRKEKIKKIYEQDYLIETRFKDRMWEKPGYVK